MPSYMDIQNAVVTTNIKETAEAVKTALSEGINGLEIINEGLLPGLKVVGDKFESGEYFVPDMMLAAMAVQEGAKLAKDTFKEEVTERKATVVLGTVRGDLHDLGKSIVGMVLDASGYNVIDLGVDVSTEKFIDAVKKYKPEFLGMSALLSTTMGEMGTVIKAVEEAGLRDNLKILVGGAVISEGYATHIGADGYGRNVGNALKLIEQML